MEFNQMVSNKLKPSAAQLQHTAA